MGVRRAAAAGARAGLGAAYARAPVAVRAGRRRGAGGGGRPAARATNPRPAAAPGGAPGRDRAVRDAAPVAAPAAIRARPGQRADGRRGRSRDGDRRVAAIRHRARTGRAGRRTGGSRHRFARRRGRCHAGSAHLGAGPGTDGRTIRRRPGAAVRDARVGYLSVHQAPVRGDVGSGDDPVLTSEDVLENRAASGRGRREAHLVTTHRGDVVVAADGGRFVAAVTAEHGAIVAPGLTLLRPDPDQLDAHFLAGVLRSTENARVSLAQTGSVGRSDVPRARVPRLPVAEQRAYGVAFRQVEELRTAVRAAAAAGTELAQLLADGVSGGTLKPPENPLESP